MSSLKGKKALHAWQRRPRRKQDGQEAEDAACSCPSTGLQLRQETLAEARFCQRHVSVWVSGARPTAAWTLISVEKSPPGSF